MHGADLLTGWSTLIFVAPLFGLLGFWMFGLDERIAAPRSRSAGRRFCHTEHGGRRFLTDPDGTPWRPISHPTLLGEKSSPPGGNRPCRHDDAPGAHPANIPPDRT